MDANSISTILKIGENIAVEFKRCGNGIENDVYETICSFLNRLVEIFLWGCWMMGLYVAFQKKQLQI